MDKKAGATSERPTSDFQPPQMLNVLNNVLYRLPVDQSSISIAVLPALRSIDARCAQSAIWFRVVLVAVTGCVMVVEVFGALVLRSA